MGFDSWSLREKIVMFWGLLIASIALIFICVSLGNLISDNSANIASWVQAIGSIAAIAAAAIGLKWQMSEGQRLQREKELRDERKANKIKYGVLAYRASDVKVWANALKEFGTNRHNIWQVIRLQCESNLNVISSIAAYDFPDPNDIWYIDSIKNRLFHLNYFLKTTNGNQDLENPDHLDKLLDKLMFCAGESQNHYESLAATLDE